MIPGKLGENREDWEDQGAWQDWIEESWTIGNQLGAFPRNFRGEGVPENQSFGISVRSKMPFSAPYSSTPKASPANPRELADPSIFSA
jgi:hypothetical protein